ncbi:MAG: hypothetical protein IK997_04010 [Bacilli bacterium]|nr:hypothetical protein [Bacilli bacterium]
MRDFEKISFKQFSKDVKDDKELYRNYKLPSRNSNKAAGYDFYLIEDIEMKPGDIVKISTGIKAHFEEDEVLMIFVRSSTGFKYNIRLVNQVGIIDADYYNNRDNEGHIFIKLQNEGDKTVSFKKGDHLAQGVFLKYLLTDSDNNNNVERRSSY